MRLTRASTKPSKLPGALYNQRKSSATPNSLRQSAAKCRFIRLACPIALLELIARLGSSQNKILLWRARLTIISTTCVAPNSLRSVLATRSFGEISLACQDSSPQAELSVQKPRDYRCLLNALPERFHVCEGRGNL